MSFIDNSRRNKMSKYLDTKKGSLEQSILGVWQTAIEEKEEVEESPFSSKSKVLDKMKFPTTGVKDMGKKPKPARKTRSKKLKEGSKEEYQKFFNAAMKKFGIDSPADLKSDEEKKKFFDYVDKNYKGEKDEEVQKLHQQLFPETKLKEGKMSQLHQLMKDGKTAEEIAKIMRVDAKTIKKLMDGHMKDIKEYYEIGTDEYRKHTEDVTPGENGEWAKHVGEKSQSMREALAKVWGVNEGKSPFKKEEKKSLTKEVKDGKTMTGKKIASVDINPTIKEKTK